MSVNSTTFDTYGYYEELKAAGISDEQAKAQTKALQKLLEGYDTATRKELATRGDIQDLRNDLKDEIRELGKDLNDKLSASKNETLRWMSGMLIAHAGLIFAILAYLKE